MGWCPAINRKKPPHTTKLMNPDAPPPNTLILSLYTSKTRQINLWYWESWECLTLDKERRGLLEKRHKWGHWGVRNIPLFYFINWYVCVALTELVHLCDLNIKVTNTSWVLFEEKHQRRSKHYVSSEERILPSRVVGLVSRQARGRETGYQPGFPILLYFSPEGRMPR